METGDPTTPGLIEEPPPPAKKRWGPRITFLWLWTVWFLGLAWWGISVGPRFASMFEQVGVELPVVSRVLFGATRVMRAVWFLIPLPYGVGVVWVVLAPSERAVRWGMWACLALLLLSILAVQWGAFQPLLHAHVWIHS